MGGWRGGRLRPLPAHGECDVHACLHACMRAQGRAHACQAVHARVHVGGGVDGQRGGGEAETRRAAGFSLPCRPCLQVNLFETRTAALDDGNHTVLAAPSPKAVSASGLMPDPAPASLSGGPEPGAHSGAGGQASPSNTGALAAATNSTAGASAPGSGARDGGNGGAGAGGGQGSGEDWWWPLEQMAPSGGSSIKQAKPGAAEPPTKPV